MSAMRHDTGARHPWCWLRVPECAACARRRGLV